MIYNKVGNKTNWYMIELTAIKRWYYGKGLQAMFDRNNARNIFCI